MFFFEKGPTCVALHPNRADTVVSGSYFGSMVVVYQQQTPISNIYTSFGPTQVKWMSVQESHTPLLAITDNNMVSVWDIRTPTESQSQCVQRLRPSSSALYTLCCTEIGDTGLLATAGEDKIVYVYDCRKWKISGQWSKVMKYEIVSLHFSSIDPSLCYVTGLDHEVFCGSWSGQDKMKNLSTLRRHGFRGDSRWIGIHRVPQTDTLVGLTETANLYVVTNPYVMAGVSSIAPTTSLSTHHKRKHKQFKHTNTQQKRTHKQTNPTQTQSENV